jgi:serine phosphatase RsbU (regulator of sigma subunit)
MANGSTLVAGATRPCAGEVENGDGFVVTHRDGVARLAVIDGLGHGPLAAEATAAARQVLEAAPEAEPLEALERCSDALKRTRGAAVSIALIDRSRSLLSFAGIGNVGARILLPDRERRLAAHRGIVGTAHRTVRTTEVALPDDWLFVMHSDGISGRFELAALAREYRGSTPQALASRLLEGWGRERDDATAMVAQPAR